MTVAVLVVTAVVMVVVPVAYSVLVRGFGVTVLYHVKDILGSSKL